MSAKSLIVLSEGYDPESLGAKCDVCTLRSSRVGGPVKPEYHSQSVASVVADFPKSKECDVGRPLVDSSGMEFTESLKAVGVGRTSVDLHLALACRPPEDDLDKVMVRWQRENKKREKQGLEPVPSPIECCRTRLLAEIDHQNVITLGKTSFHALNGKPRPILDIRGGPVTGGFDAVGNFVHGESATIEKAVSVLPTLSPGFVMRSRRWTRAFRSDLSRAFRWFDNRLAWQDPIIELNPAPDLLDAFLRSSDHFVFDVETTFQDPTVALLKCVGISTQEAAVVVHTMSIEGPDGRLVEQDSYTSREFAEVLGILRDFFADPTRLKVGHNAGYFDRMVIKNHFGVDPAPLMDTILLHRSVESELPHKLGYVGSVYTDVTAWKDAHTAEVAATDKELGTYCVFHGTMVQLADGTSMPIHEIVEKRLPVVVQSRDPETASAVQKRVTGWFRNTVAGQTWKQIRLATTRPKARGLIATPEHEVHTLRGRVRAEDIRVGDDVFINEARLSETQRAAVIGTLLGDSSLIVSPTQRGNRFSAPRAALQGGHTTDAGFAQYKVQRLRGFTRLLPERPSRSVAFRGKVSEVKPFLRFASPMLHQFVDLQPLVMDADGARRLRVRALEECGAVGMAWWFMDDGCLQKAGRAVFRQDTIAISAQRYPLEDLQEVKGWLEERFGRIYLGRDKVLRFTPDAARAFGVHIAPHLPPEARYKLPRDYVFPEYDTGEWATSSDFATAKVVSVSDYSPERAEKHQRIRADIRYCLGVEDTHNFMTADGLIQNCAIDCVVTARALPKLADAVRLRSQQHIVEFDHRVQTACVGLHEAGMFIDRKRRDEEAVRLKKLITEWAGRTRAAAGRDVLNVNSTMQIRDLLFSEWGVTPSEFTKLGDPSTSDEALRLIRTQNSDDPRTVQFIDALRRFRKYAKEYGTYVRKLVPENAPLDGDNRLPEDDDEEDREKNQKKELVGLIMHDGRVRPDYNAHGTTSGRLSSSNPNAQNWPKHLRGMVTAQPGHVIIGADADQLELRIIAAIAGMQNYLDIFTEGGDPHALTASLMFGKNFDGAEKGGDVWTKLRNLAKGIKYASFYGSGDETVHGIVTSAEDKDGKLLYPDLSLREVATIRRNWLKGIPQLPQWWEATMEEYRSQGFILDPVLGRRRDFLDGEMFNEIVNFPIQSAGAHIIHYSTFDLLDTIPFGKWGPGTGLIAQVHDALYVEAPCHHAKFDVPKLENGKPDEKQREFGWCPIGCKCEANWAAREIEQAMNRAVPGLPGVRFSAKAKIGLRWSDV